MEHFNEILFLDIETVPVSPDFAGLPERMQSEWKRKARTFKMPADMLPEEHDFFYDRAGIYSEFAKVVCISFGSLYHRDSGWEMRLKALVSADEHELLTQFCDVVARFAGRFPDFRFCGHNIKEFDIPFLCRRMVINSIPLPLPLQVAGKKPWEVTHADTLDLWRFGDYKNFTSLSLLAEVLGIPSPKSDIDGSMVADVFWKDKDLERIGAYCMQDVLTSAKVYLRLKGIHGIDPAPVYV